jgi:arginase
MVSGGRVSILGVPIDLGGNHRGVDMGPSCFHVAGLNGKLRDLGYSVEDLGNVFVPSVESIKEDPLPHARYQKQIADVCEDLATQIEGALKEDRFPICLGGDHSAAIGSISGSAAYFAARQEKIGVIWVDAHTDMNTPDTSPSGNIHGMPMACLLGHGPKELTHILRKDGFPPHLAPENCAFIGIRDVVSQAIAFFSLLSAMLNAPLFCRIRRNWIWSTALA